MKPRNRITTTRITAALACVAGFVGVAAATAPAAQAFTTEACRQFPAYASSMGVAVRPCFDATTTRPDGGPRIWEAQADVLAPQTDVRFYLQVGTSASRTSTINWSGVVVSQVVGPDSNWVRIAPLNGPDYTGDSRYYWARSWAVDGSIPLLSDVESAPINC
ncbi:hypothetical protein [Kutzneria buriramensis]|uniref:Secreted protein n=1 Tax=Kutzneria buriramensis TaxID=1045776 RepID=A0A3E0IA69_9PSEU|nr:hypothetical protein [Kutzneria buriramensis]REH55634.1 hypothetical protein BCF44_101660 [Kutzneria buriramensis]